MTKLNEMNDDYANGAGLDPATSAPQPEMTVELPMTTISMDLPDTAASAEGVASGDIDPESVLVYSSNIASVSSGGGSNITAFDVTFTVSFTCPDTGTFSTYQVIKRIGVDKMKLAHEAKMSTPITVVEAKKPEQYVYSKDRIKALAGLK
ncbi:hypothetical protein [Acinetobacter sp.]|uniref:hypothetical protein n=1 Tax=Acinetobacter sp. TaxID=472 RepID=UPI00388F4C88